MNQEELLQVLEEQENFGMFSKAGNKRCKSAIRKIVKAFFSKKRYESKEIHTLIAKNVAKVVDVGHPEVLDTAVEEHIWWFVNKARIAANYDEDFINPVHYELEVYDHIKE